MYMYIIPNVCQLDRFHRIQRPITSEGAKRRIWGDITVLRGIFWQINTAWSEGINKDGTCMYTKFFHKKKFDSANTSVKFFLINRGKSSSEILHRSVCDAETFNDQT